MFYLLCFFFKRTFFITKVIIFCEEIYGKISMQHMKGMIHKMEKEFESTRNALVVNLSGEIDQYAAAELKGKIDIEIEASPKKNMIINLAGVSLMDSSGIGLIVGRYKAVRAVGGKLVICGAIPSVNKMIELSGICKVIENYKNIREADMALQVSDKSERNEI